MFTGIKNPQLTQSLNSISPGQVAPLDSTMALHTHHPQGTHNDNQVQLPSPDQTPEARFSVEHVKTLLRVPRPPAGSHVLVIRNEADYAAAKSSYLSVNDQPGRDEGNGGWRNETAWQQEHIRQLVEAIFADAPIQSGQEKKPKAKKGGKGGKGRVVAITVSDLECNLVAWELMVRGVMLSDIGLQLLTKVCQVCIERRTGGAMSIGWLGEQQEALPPVGAEL